MPSIWTKHYERAYKEYYGESTPPNSARHPNWGALALRILKNKTLSTETSNSLSPITNSSDSNTSSSQTSSVTITDDFLKKFQTTHQKMDDKLKWKLPFGLVVEDEMLKYGLTCKHENAVHSFILDINNPVWLERFSDSQDWQAIMSNNMVGNPNS
ncbi:hypothetical protein BDC45DRAFT_534392 [Circinella umbellata]|nr:hypothetical protein BDC45DRAFT_534392 [Circinella umbellata]